MEVPERDLYIYRQQILTKVPKYMDEGIVPLVNGPEYTGYLYGED